MILQCHYHSPILRRNTQINVFLPTPGEEGETLKGNFKVLYLLHGLHGDASSWLHRTNISRYAEDAGIAVVMPSVGNSFYQDMAHGERFFTYMTRELPEYIQGLFPVSKDPKDTFIAGLSMGGYGAYYIGLSCPEKFAAIGSFSGALDIGFRVTPVKMDAGVPMPFYVEDCFGDITKVAGSDRDVFTLYEKAAAKGTVPRLYQSCGTSDFLYGMNRLSNRKLTELGAQITYRETEGIAHEWGFWDSEVQYFLKWIEEEQAPSER